MERFKDAGREKFVMLEPADGSLGIYGSAGDVNDFVEAQGVRDYIEANARYASLLAVFRERIAETVDFDRVEPREFWRRATREALAESNYDANQLIDAMFDADDGIATITDDQKTVWFHLKRLADMIGRESNPDMLAAAAVMLAVSLGFSPADAW